MRTIFSPSSSWPRRQSHWNRSPTRSEWNRQSDSRRQARQDPVASYIRNLERRRDELVTELKELDSQDENSYMSKTSRALHTLYDTTSKADSHFWTRHPRRTAAIVGAVIGGGIAMAIAIPLIGWVAALVGWTVLGITVGCIVGTVGAHVIVNTAGHTTSRAAGNVKPAVQPAKAQHTRVQLSRPHLRRQQSRYSSEGQMAEFWRRPGKSHSRIS